jgi:hypothetical protein
MVRLLPQLPGEKPQVTSGGDLTCQNQTLLVEESEIMIRPGGYAEPNSFLATESTDTASRRIDDGHTR